MSRKKEGRDEVLFVRISSNAKSKLAKMALAAGVSVSVLVEDLITKASK